MPTKEEAELRKRLAAWKKSLAAREMAAQDARKTARRRARLAARARAAVEKISADIRNLKGGPKVSLKWALAQVGTTESPAGSNKGPKISAWQRETAGIDGAPWCGAFVGMALKKAGVKITPRVVFTPYIVEDAKLGRNGFTAWIIDPAKARAGDLVLYNFGSGGAKHVGVTVKGFRACEGNTSAGPGGSQDNGGGVFVRDRSPLHVMGWARPDWP